jgi:hypothetical protein
MNQGRETRMETETQKMVNRERVMLMMLGALGSSTKTKTTPALNTG